MPTYEISGAALIVAARKQSIRKQKENKNEGVDSTNRFRFVVRSYYGIMAKLKNYFNRGTMQ